MILSICMMVKNEEKYLEQCLKSLKPLMDSIKSELIIVDTGSTDSTAEIAKRFTEKVHFHEWNNDFSEMRNITISYAKGKWLMIVDGDEVLEDCTELIKLLKSGMEKNYNSVMISVKNFVTSDESKYSIMGSARLFRNDGTVRYQGSVHNQVVKKGPGIKLVNTMLKHYGYIADDPELMERKFRRTSAILLKELSKDPDNLYYRYQMSVSYLMHKDVDEALAEAEKVYDMIEDDRDKIDKYPYVIGNIAKICIAKGMYDRTIDICNRGIEVYKDYVDLWFYLQFSYTNIGEPEKSVNAGLEYLRLVENYQQLEIACNASIVMDQLDKKSDSLFILAKEYIKLKKHEEAVDCISKMDFNPLLTSDVDNQMVDICFKTGKFEQLKAYAQKIIIKKGQDAINKFIFKIEECRRKASRENLIAFLTEFSRDEGEYSELNKIRLAYETKDEKLRDLLIDFFGKVEWNTSTDFYSDVIYYLICTKYAELPDLLMGIQERNLNTYIRFMAKNHSDFCIKVLDYLKALYEDNALSVFKFKKVFYELLLRNHKGLDDSGLLYCIKQYIKYGYNYLTLVYNSFILENELTTEMKGMEEAAILYMQKALVFKNDTNQARAYLDKAYHVYPALRKVIFLLFAEIQNENEKRLKELEEIKTKAKENIKLLIESGMLKEADGAILQYESMAGEDTDIYSIKAVVAIIKKQYGIAEYNINMGLAAKPDDFDLLMNAGYMYEVKGMYIKAIQFYKKAKRQVFFNADRRNEIDIIIDNIIKQHKPDIENELTESKENRIAWNFPKVLFVFFGNKLNNKINAAAKVLNDLAIDVDLEYQGTRPDLLFPENELPYRKMLALFDVNDMVGYCNFYQYDAIHVFGCERSLKDYMKGKIRIPLIFNSEVPDDMNDIASYYEKNLKLMRTGLNSKSDGINDKLDLSIVIPTFNRSSYLYRALSHFCSLNDLQFNIIVLDSSDSAEKEKNRSIINKFGQNNIKYMVFDRDMDFYFKINSGLNTVGTEFVCLCADDDFITREGIVSSISALGNDKTLFSAKGKNLYYEKTMARLKEYDFFSGLYEDSPVRRLETISKGFVPSMIYQVFRTEKFRKIYSFIVDNRDKLPSNSTFQEYLFYFMVIITGKIGKLSVDLNIRDKGVPRASEVKNFPHSVIEGDFNENYHAFKSFLISYSKLMGIYSDDYDSRIDSIFYNFIVYFLAVPKENIIFTEGQFDMEKLEAGMRKSWVWPADLFSDV